MSNDEPSGPPPEDDPFVKRPRPPRQPPSEDAAPPPGQGPYGSPPPPPGPGGPYGPGQGGGGPYGSGGPYGGGGPWQGGGQGPYGGGPYGGGPYGGGPGGQDPYGGRPGPGQGPLAGMPPVAPFGTRLAARIIDALIIAIPLAIISLGVNGFDLSTTNGQSEADQIGDTINTGQQWLWTLVSLVVYIGYDTWMTHTYGRTLGKRWLKLRVGMLADGAVPGTGASLLRATVLWLPALVCCYCIWWIAIALSIVASRPYRQGWHDKAAKTVVVTT
ncbi:RDD family protein [Streptomyces fuscigenes]|uniref:RDD family protein n=1 Tax=Streptomyces fuscigenes TaxID=1528880 RepID=UPI001F2E1DF9|nr:RDD family protein [Streptomyces fuscigenes]MCF3965494.1 RDD family protein [Streptomyces fuscigenes]